jgi:hypothetical protein
LHILKEAFVSCDYANHLVVVTMIGHDWGYRRRDKIHESLNPRNLKSFFEQNLSPSLTPSNYEFIW